MKFPCKWSRAKRNIKAKAWEDVKLGDKRKFNTVDDTNFHDSDSASADSTVTSWGSVKKPNQSGTDRLRSWSDCSMTSRYYNSPSLHMHIIIRIPAAGGIKNTLRGSADGLILQKGRKL